MKAGYLLIDKHNPNKAHHITIDGSQVYYNQAIRCDRHEGRKDQVPGFPGWYDFYTPELVRKGGDHGYQNYIDAAIRLHGRPRVASR